MATSGTITFNKSGKTSAGGYIIGKIEWTQTKDEAANKSKIKAALYVKKGHDSMTLTQSTVGTWCYQIIVFGQYWNANSASGTSVFTDWVKLGETTVTVSHKSDGSLAGEISGTVMAPDGTSYDGLVSSGSKTITFDSIPRASAISSLSATYIGSPCTVKWTPASDSFGYKIKYSLGSWSYTTAAIAPKKTTAYTYSYLLPYAVANQLPSAKTGTLTVTLYSYSDTACTKLMGSDAGTNTVTVPDNSSTKPTASIEFSSKNDGLPSQFAGLFIQGKSKFYGKITAEGKYGAGIKSYQFKYAGTSKAVSSNTYTSAVLSSSGRFKVYGTAIDARGYEGVSDEYFMTVIAYSPPSIAPAAGENAIVCQRCDSAGNPNDAGTCLRIKARRSYSKVTLDGTQYNFCTLRYRYKKQSATTYSAWVTLLAGSDTSSDTVDAVISGVTFASDVAYAVQIGVVDDIGEDAHITAFVPTDEVDFHLRENGKGAGFGEYAEEENALSISSKWNVYGRLWGLGKCKNNLAAEENLNTYKDFGTYSIPSTAIAETLTNCPSTTAGVLVVSSAIGDGLNSGAYVYVLQKYIPFTGDLEYVRLLFTDANGTWKYTGWQARGEREWVNLGLSSAVSTSESNCGRYANGTCAYKVVNENHVYIAFNCAFTFNGSAIQVNSAALPAKYRPPRNVYAMCATGGRATARILVNASGNVLVDWIQVLSSAEQTASSSVKWIDGYIDYWI